MPKTRVVLAEQYRPLADNILERTRLPNLSALFLMLLVNYGEQLVLKLGGDK